MGTPMRDGRTHDADQDSNEPTRIPHPASRHSHPHFAFTS
jgi:hypothetical protein